MSSVDLPVLRRTLPVHVERRCCRSFDPASLSTPHQRKPAFNNRYALRACPRNTGRLAGRVAVLLEAICRVHQVTLADLKGAARCKAIVAARHHGMWLLRHHTSLSLSQIGAVFKRDHTSALHGITRWQERLEAE